MYFFRMLCRTFPVSLACSFTLLAAFTVNAQSGLKGTVVDKDAGLPVPGVVIRIDGSFSATTTDKSGNFVFENLYGEKITLRTSHISFQEYTLAINLPSAPVKLELTARTYLSDEVNITALKATDRSAVAFTEVTKAEIDKTNLGQDLPMLLQLQPSVNVTSDAGNGIGYTGIRIRGSDATRVNVTINGIPVNDAESHQVYWVNLPDVAASAQDIQVQRGVGTSVNGAGAFGGSINLQTSSMRPEPFAEASSYYGSFNTARNSLKFGTGLLKEKFALEGRLSQITSNGFIDRASSRLRSIYLSGGYYGKNQSLRFVLLNGKEKTYQAWYGVPEDSLATNRTYNPAGQYTDRDGNIRYYDNQTDNYGQEYYQLFYSKETSNQWLLNVALFYTKGKGYYEEYVQYPLIDPGGLDSNMTDSLYIQPSHIQQRWLDNDFMGMTWSVKKQFESVDFMVGGAFSRYEGDHFGKIIWQNYNILPYEPFEYYDDNASKTDRNIFVKANWNLSDRWFIMGDAQLRHVYYSFTGKDIQGNPLPSDVSLTFFNPKAGITFVPNTWHRFHLYAGVGQKEPVRDDYRASTQYSRPQPELLHDYETGYRYNGHRLATGIN
ncbi:MAG: TonB-dependent receptor, partial [Bacteroidota bacterium]